jgi:hypothetical protein
VELREEYGRDGMVSRRLIHRHEMFCKIYLSDGTPA